MIWKLGNEKRWLFRPFDALINDHHQPDLRTFFRSLLHNRTDSQIMLAQVNKLEIVMEKGLLT